jgi:hypothetical protein
MLGIALAFASTAPVPAASAPSAPAQLGQLLMNAPNLSQPHGISCVSCHQAATGFSGDHGSQIGVAFGIAPTRRGTARLRRTPGAAPCPAIRHPPTAAGDALSSGFQRKIVTNCSAQE